MERKLDPAFGFSIPAITNFGNSGNLLRPSADVLQPETPPGIYVLLQTNVKVHFDRAMTARSKSF
jgi:hypothetical protein